MKKLMLILAVLISDNTLAAGPWFFTPQNLNEYDEKGLITFYTPIFNETLDCREFEVAAAVKVPKETPWVVEDFPVQYFLKERAKCAIYNGKSLTDHFNPNFANRRRKIDYRSCEMEKRKTQSDKFNSNCNLLRRRDRSHWQQYEYVMCKNQWRNYSWQEYYQRIKTACLNAPAYIDTLRENEAKNALEAFKATCERDSRCVGFYESIDQMQNITSLSSFKTDINRYQIERQSSKIEGKSHIIKMKYDAALIASYLKKIREGKDAFIEESKDKSVDYKGALIYLNGKVTKDYYLEKIENTISEYGTYNDILKALYKRSFTKLSGEVEIDGRFRTYDKPSLQQVTIDWDDQVKATTSTVKNSFVKNEKDTNLRIIKPKITPKVPWIIELGEKPAQADPKQVRLEVRQAKDCEELNRLAHPDFPKIDCNKQ